MGGWLWTWPIKVALFYIQLSKLRVRNQNGHFPYLKQCNVHSGWLLDQSFNQLIKVNNCCYLFFPSQESKDLFDFDQSSFDIYDITHLYAIFTMGWDEIIVFEL